MAVEAPSLAQLRSQAINEIVSDITTNGLKPASKLKKSKNNYLASADEHVNEEVYGLFLHKGGDKADIIHALYPWMTSIFPTVTERKSRPKWPNNDVMATERGQSFFMVISPVRLLEKTDQEIISDLADAGEGLSFCYGVEANLFSHLLFPQSVWGHLPETSLKTPARVHVINRSVRRFLYRKDKVPAMLPDIESWLMDFSASVTEKYWMHAVRLPTEEDIAQGRI